MMLVMAQQFLCRVECLRCGERQRVKDGSVLKMAAYILSFRGRRSLADAVHDEIDNPTAPPLALELPVIQTQESQTQTQTQPRDDDPVVQFQELPDPDPTPTPQPFNKKFKKGDKVTSEPVDLDLD